MENLENLKFRYYVLQKALTYLHDKLCTKCEFYGLCWGEHGFYEQNIERFCIFHELKAVVKKLMEIYRICEDRLIECFPDIEDIERFEKVLKGKSFNIGFFKIKL